MRRAFTLIELLVVIAIIAILAAILFPVFAQAKDAAKKTQALSQIKQTATGTLIYIGDNDDNFPSGLIANSAGNPTFFTGGNALYPAGWHTNGRVESEEVIFWANSVQPYLKSLDLTRMPKSQKVRITAWAPQYAAPIRQWGSSNWTYNGYLQFLSSSSVAAPSTLPLLWQGIGDLEQEGLARTNPRLSQCSGLGDCRFNPTGHPQGAAANGSTGIVGFGGVNYTPFSQGALFVATDSSARLVKIGTGNRSGANTVVPWFELNAAGQFPGTTFSFWGCRLDNAANQNYLAAMRPDNDFTPAFGDRCF